MRRIDAMQEGYGQRLLMEAMDMRGMLDITGGGDFQMNEKQLILIEVLQQRMSDMIANMEKDPFYAPPKWSFENIWNALESLKHL